MSTADQFRRQLRDALNSLYDPDILRNNKLVDLFGFSARGDAPLALQRLLVENIENLKPAPGISFYLEKRMIFDVLSFRYIEQFKQEEVAHQVGVSIRQLRREQEKAIEALAYSLIEKHDLSGKFFSSEKEAPPRMCP